MEPSGQRFWFHDEQLTGEIFKKLKLDVTVSFFQHDLIKEPIRKCPVFKSWLIIIKIYRFEALQYVFIIFFMIYVDPEFHFWERPIICLNSESQLFQPGSFLYIQGHCQTLTRCLVSFNFDINKTASTFASCCFMLNLPGLYYNFIQKYSVIRNRQRAIPNTDSLRVLNFRNKVEI